MTADDIHELLADRDYTLYEMMAVFGTSKMNLLSVLATATFRHEDIYSYHRRNRNGKVAEYIGRLGNHGKV